MNIPALIGGLVLMISMSFSLQAQPYSGYPPHGAGSTPSHGSSFSTQKGMRFLKSRDEKGYILRIEILGMTPEAIQTTLNGRTLSVQNRESRQVERQSDRGGYSFSSVSSNMRRRFHLPPDADISGMQRSEEDGAVVIRFPYAEGRRY
jgi:HSP20 family molecular chaperone IbpA